MPGVAASIVRAGLRPENCTFEENDAGAGGCNVAGGARGFGGGIYVASDVLMQNCIVRANTTRTNGGGIYTTSGAQGALENCTFAYNSPGGIWVGNSNVTLVNGIVFFNGSYQISGSLNATYSDIEGSYAGEGNIDCNPSFFSTTDLQILEGSCCQDSGNADPIYNDCCFPPSLGEIRNDMGAHGGPGACRWENSSCLACAQDGDVNDDGLLTPGDALCAFNIFLSGGTLPPDCDVPDWECELTAADPTCDGQVTPGDALAIFNRFPRRWQSRFVLRRYDGCGCACQIAGRSQSLRGADGSGGEAGTRFGLRAAGDGSGIRQGCLRLRTHV